MKNKLFWLLLIMVMYLLPNAKEILGYFYANSDYTFIGDRYSNYILEDIREGNLLQKNLYTTENHPGFMIKPSLLLWGLIGKNIPVDNFFLILLAKLGYLLLFMIALKKYIFFYGNKHIYKWFVLIIGASSGLGIIFKNFIPNSIDLWMPQVNFFQTMANYPGYLFCVVLLLTSFNLFLNNYRKAAKSKLLLISFLSSLILLEQPFVYLTFILTIIMSIVFNESNLKERLKALAGKSMILIFPGIIAILYIGLFIKWPVLIGMVFQLNSNTNSLLSYLSGYGIISFFTGYYLLHNRLQKQNIFYKLNVSWITIGMFLIFLPVNLQYYSILGLFIPVSILGYEILMVKIKYLAVKIGRMHIFLRKIPADLIVFSLSVFLGITNIYLIRNQLADLRDHKNSLNFINNDDKKAMNWLKRNKTGSMIILSDAIYSPILPVFTQSLVYFGLNFIDLATINYGVKANHVINFFFKDTDRQRKEFLKTNNISYLFIGTKNKDTEDYIIWESKKYLQKVYDAGGAKIFKVL